MSYLYEIHLHTSESSKCGASPGADYIAPYIDKGYTGIIVTDHFFNGNTNIYRKLPWAEWVKQFCRGYEAVKEEGDKRGLDVFFGFEETFDEGDDYLIYGLDKQWLLEHPQVREFTRGQLYRAVKDAGGCMVQAHPFRQRDYIQKIILSAGCVDGVEVANGGNETEADALAYRYAKKLGKAMLAGSDIHGAYTIETDEIFGVYFDKKLNSIDDFVKAVCNNEVAGMKVDMSRFNLLGNERIYLPYEVRDENDKVTGKSWKEAGEP